MDSNHRFLGVGQGSSPLDHGTVQLAVTTGPTPNHDRARLIAMTEVGVEPTDKSPVSHTGRFSNLRPRPRSDSERRAPKKIPSRKCAKKISVLVHSPYTTPRRSGVTAGQGILQCGSN